MNNFSDYFFSHQADRPTLGRDGRYYFVFTMDKGRVKEIPDQLVHQSLLIAQKVERTLLKKQGHKSLVVKKSN